MWRPHPMGGWKRQRNRTPGRMKARGKSNRCRRRRAGSQSRLNEHVLEVEGCFAIGWVLDLERKFGSSWWSPTQYILVTLSAALFAVGYVAGSLTAPLPERTGTTRVGPPQSAR